MTVRMLMTSNSTFGIHPHSADKYDDAMEARIMKNMEHPTVVAWGECGLDYCKFLTYLLRVTYNGTPKFK